jgi:hypothetical protein
MGRCTVLPEDPAKWPIPPVKLFNESKVFKVPHVLITID